MKLRIKKIGLVNEIVNLHKDNNKDLEKYQEEEIEKTEDNASEEIYSITLIKCEKFFSLEESFYIKEIIPLLHSIGKVKEQVSCSFEK